MLSFRTFIVEKFLKGLRTGDGYAEIYVNPTKNELIECGKKTKLHDYDTGRNYVIYDNIGAIVSSKKIWCWKREKGFHADVMESWPYKKEPWYPEKPMCIYMSYDPITDALGIWSSRFTGRGADMANPDRAVMRLAKVHPWFKKFIVRLDARLDTY